jgi:hypothetical protein
MQFIFYSLGFLHTYGIEGRAKQLLFRADLNFTAEFTICSPFHRV